MSRQISMLLKPTEEECVAACVRAGMPEREGSKMFVHYEMVRWTYGKSKTPISSLALAVRNWKLGWEDRGCPGQAGPASNGSHSNRPLSGAMVMTKRDELNRVMDRIKKIRETVESHTEMRPAERAELKELAKRREELKAELGVKY